MLNTGMDKDYKPSGFNTVIERKIYYLSLVPVLPASVVTTGTPQTEWYDEFNLARTQHATTATSSSVPYHPPPRVLTRHPSLSYFDAPTPTTPMYISKESPTGYEFSLPTGCIYNLRWGAPEELSPEYLEELIEHPQWQEVSNKLAVEIRRKIDVEKTKKEGKGVVLDHGRLMIMREEPPLQFDPQTGKTNDNQINLYFSWFDCCYFFTHQFIFILKKALSGSHTKS